MRMFEGTYPHNRYTHSPTIRHFYRKIAKVMMQSLRNSTTFGEIKKIETKKTKQKTAINIVSKQIQISRIKKKSYLK